MLSYTFSLLACLYILSLSIYIYFLLLKFFIFILFFYFTILYWFCHTVTWIRMGVHMFPICLGHSSAPALSTLYHASNLDWRFVSYMIIYMFQYHSPISSHPRPLPQSPGDCSIHQCLFCCLAYKGYRYPKFHIYVLVYCIGVFLSGLLHSV